MLTVQVAPKHKIVGVPESEAVRNLFPNAQVHEFDGVVHLLLPHEVTQTVMLRRLGYDVPSPILTHYDWPHPPGKAPFDVQKRTAALLSLNDRAYVLNDKGTGKTATLLWAWDFLNKNKLAKKLLVVAPLSTLRATWEHEIFAVLPHRKCAVLHGDKKSRTKKLNDPNVEIFIINHDGVKTILAELMQRKDIDTLCLDELAVYRNHGTARQKDMKKYAQTMKWVWGMTGGPIPNCPTNVWGQASIVTPNNVPKFYSRFREELMYRPGGSQFLWLPKPDATERAYAVLQPSVRFALEDVTELPDAVKEFIDIGMGPKQAKAYKAIKDHCYMAVQQGEVTAANAGAALNKLLQIACGWVYTTDGQILTLDNDARMDRLIDDVLSTSRKALVFMPFKHALAGVSRRLKAEGIDHACVSGDTPERDRADIFSAFQNTNKYKVLAAHPQCLAHGVTLTAADLCIWFAPITSLEIYDQACARIRRVGQQHKQLYLHYRSTPVEARIYKLLEQHQNVQQKLLDLVSDATKDLVV